VLTLALVAMPGVGRAQGNANANANQNQNRERDLNDLPDPADALRNLQNTGRALFMMADVNHDGLVSMQEAIDVNNMMVGGFFFRADADGNGTVTQQEWRGVTDKYLNQNPWVRYVVDSIRTQARQKNGQNTNPNPLASFVALLDANNDKQVQASELRQLVQTITQSFFAAADTNRDGQMSPSEVNASVAGGVRAMAQFAFQQADTDNNNQLSRAEYDKAIVEPANVAFQILDLNHDGEISQQEAQQIERVAIGQIKMMQIPEPANSPRNLIESGRLPREAAPVPNFASPNANLNRPQQTAPAPAPAPAPGAAPVAPR